MARGSPFIYIGPNSDPREVDKSSWQERHEEWPATQNGQNDVTVRGESPPQASSRHAQWKTNSSTKILQGTGWPLCSRIGHSQSVAIAFPPDRSSLRAQLAT